MTITIPPIKEYKLDLDLSGAAPTPEEYDYQPLLISGTNIKTINGNSLLGSGDIVITVPTGDFLETSDIGVNVAAYDHNHNSVYASLSSANVFTGTQTINNTLSISGQITSSVTSGTAPLVVASTTKVNNLNSDYLDGYTSADFLRKTETATLSGALTFSNNITLSGAGRRIIADFSSASLADRCSFQSSVSNGATAVQIIPNGTGTTGGVRLFNSSDPTNANSLFVSCQSSSAVLEVTKYGSSVAIPLLFYVNSAERLRIDTDGSTTVTGDLKIGGTSKRILGDFSNAIVSNRVIVQSSTSNGETSLSLMPNGSSTESNAAFWNSSNLSAAQYGVIGMHGTSSFRIASSHVGSSFLPITFYTSDVERIRISVDGNVGIGTSSPAQKVDIVSTNFVPLQVTGGGATDNCQLRFVGSVSGNSWAIGNNVSTGGVGRNFDVYDLALNVNRLRIDSSGNVGIGTSAPSSKLSFGSTIGLDFAVFEHAGGGNKYGIGMSGAGTGGDPYRTKIYANGSEYLCITSYGYVGIGTSAPTQKLTVQSGNLELKGVVQQILFNTNTPAHNYWIAANISDEVQDGLYIGKGGTGGGIATAGSQKIIKIDSSNNVLVIGSGVLGYGTGAGGSVTQATSKSTAVTLNKPCGQITTHNAALAAGATAFFTVNNSLVSTSSVVVCNVVGFTSYVVDAMNIASGAFTIRLANFSMGSLSESVVINFAVLSGATS